MVLSLDELRGPECEWCGASIEYKRPDAGHCSRKCTIAHRNEIKRLERIEEKATRAPCPNCGAAISAEMNGNRIYCSAACRASAAYQKRKHRQPHPKECEHCRTWFNAYYPHQRFCSPWCKATGAPSGFVSAFMCEAAG